jgi:methionine-rich copper-binding protein CopC
MGSIRRRLMSFVLASFVCAAAVLGLAGPAAAHDAAESSSPAEGASVPVPPEKVSVTFSNNPLGIGSAFSIKDASGAEWADGAVQIVDNVASQKLKAGAPAGQYTVAWRVVSSDSHPIEGTFSFTAAAAAEGLLRQPARRRRRQFLPSAPLLPLAPPSRDKQRHRIPPVPASLSNGAS